MFDGIWYADRHRLEPGVDALDHYRSTGWRRGLDPGPSFSLEGYLEANPDVRAACMDPLLHFIRHGREEGRQTVKDRDDDAIRASGLFDAAWYAERIGLPPEADPLHHYRTFGWRDGLDPGPLFSVNAYLEAYSDVGAAGVDPLLHFVRRGRGEGRRIGPIDDRQPTLTLNCADPAPSLRLLVAIHAFYIDVFEDLCPLLKNIPERYTLCVAISAAEHISRVRDAVSANNLDVDLICNVVQNRGRNFGSLLSEFSAQIERHDILLHLHTKRSLYSGREQSEWRKSLYSALTGSRPLVCGILNTFTERSDVGLVYPAAYRDLPYWAHHWLSNGGSGAALLRRLGVAEVPDGYFDFPVGGMFWARVEALRPLFAARLTYADFPPEAGQTDGTTAHAIERVVGVLSAHRGYRFVEIDYASGSIKLDWSDRNLVQYRNQSLEGFKALLQGVALVSFDIFDTLVVRPSMKPDSILHYVEHRMLSALPGNAFFSLRKRAEDVARAIKHFEGDVDITEIYAQFPRTDGWTESLIQTAKAMELALDHEVVRPRPGSRELVRLARQAGCRVIAISDTYLPRAAVLEILARCGFGDLIDRLYVSNEEQARKDRGDLWANVLRIENVEPERWLHVGDNEQSDIQAACDRGLRYFHVMNPSILSRLKGFGSTSRGAADWASELVVGPAILRLAGDPFLDGQPLGSATLTSAEEVGYVAFGPIVFSFLAWIMAHPALRQVDRLCFLSREGYLLQRAYEEVRARCPTLDLPPSIYLLASRRACLGASQAVNFSPDRVLDGIGGFNGQFDDMLFNRVGFATDDPTLGSWPIRLPRDKAAVAAALEVLRDQIISHSQGELDRYRAYLHSIGLVEEGSYGLVDVGYSGTIQKSLQDILAATFVGFYMGTTPSATAVEDGGGFAFGCFCDEVDHGRSRAPVMLHSLAVEAFLTAPHGQVTMFDADGPVMKPCHETASGLAMLDELHRGAVAYCIELVEVYGPDLLTAPCASQQVQEGLRMLCEGQVLTGGRILAALSVEDDFCGNAAFQPFDRLGPQHTEARAPR